MRVRPLACESLETRDVPSAVLDSFDTARVPYAPDGWQQWASNGSQYYSVSRAAVLSGSQSVSVFGTQNVESRLWQPTALSGDVKLSLAVRADTPAPITLFGRGSNLNAATANSQGVSISRGGAVELRDVTGGVSRVIQAVAPKLPVAAGWLRVTLELRGSQASVQVQRLDTLQYLNTSGNWQGGAATAITQVVTAKASGQVGVGRLSGQYGTAFIDDFAATPIVAMPAPVPTLPAPPAPATPAAGNKFDHIRIAQLAYAGQKITAVETQLFKDTVDLVVANPAFLNAFETASAGTEKVIYSNVSNVYEGLLTNWLDTADRTGTSREAAFYHVAEATPFTGGSPSSIPVTWFWNVAKTTPVSATNVTANARGTQSSGVAFGAAQEAIALGTLEKFHEVNITINKPRSEAFHGTWEYSRGIDAAGKVNAWAPLPITYDDTNRLKASGRVGFTPPVDWASGSVNNSRQYYVRFRTTAGAASDAPVASKILGRDYVNARGGNSGVIPAFDAQADANHDGYLNPAEFANHRAGFDARFVNESRLFYPNYGQMRFVVNPTHDAVVEWEGDYHADYLAKNPNADGLFLDNQNGKIPFTSPVLEATANYTAESAAMVAAIKEAIDDRTVIVNTSGVFVGSQPDGVTKEAGIAFEEFLLRPSAVNWATLHDVAAVVNRRLAASPTSEVILDSSAGSTSMLDASLRIGVLSYYYLLADADRTYLMFFGGQSPTSSWQNRWVPAAAVDVGDAQAAMTTFASGRDLQNGQLEYKVFGRQYENALVLFKPLSYTRGQGTGTTAAATATTHALNGNYRPLNADGTQGGIITSITLKNGQGAVLMKV